VELAARAGDQALLGRRGIEPGSTVSYSTKSSATDPVTEFDRNAERILVEGLRAARPGDGIVGEEGAARPGSSGLVWHVDPIDGTANFVYDLPAWTTSVAVVDADGPVAGAVYAPVLGEMFSAARGAGATLNDHALAVTSTSDLRLAMVATVFGYDAAVRRSQAEVLTTLIDQVRDVRRFGSAALDLCFVAAGRVDAYYEAHLNSWDRLAGELIATEAGALSSGLGGHPTGPHMVVASTPAIHADLVTALERAISRTAH
jgi:myo-inositol-1(or 4)-monophosphatase